MATATVERIPELELPAAPPATIPGEILAKFRQDPARTYVRYWDGEVWRQMTRDDFLRQALRIAAALVAEGVEAGDRVILMSENRVEWLLADFAVLSVGAVTVPIYASSTLASAKVIVETTKARLAIASGPERAGLLTSAGVPKVKQIEPDVNDWRRRPPEPAELQTVRARLADLKPDELATVIPTSGTTGEPKGVMLRHRNFTDMARSALQVFPFDESDTLLSLIPYAHVYERMDGIFVPTMAGCTIAIGRGQDRLAEDIAEIRPTAMVNVPRLFEKVYQRVFASLAKEPMYYRQVVRWALAVGARRGRRADMSPHGPIEGLAERLVLGKLRLRVTGGRLRFFASGGAPLSQKVEEFFWSLQIKILQGWGMTETTSAATSNTETEHRFRTVGKPLPGIEVKIAEDGEILVKGPAVMAGYMERPEETAETVVDGWLRTGDIGFVDGDGFLTITDRKKDLLKTSGGKYIAPQPIEAALMADRYVASAMVVGDARPYAIALIAPDWQGLAADGKFTGEPETLCGDPGVRAFFEPRVAEINRNLAGFETIKRFELLPRDFTEEAGELTPTLKPRRRVVLEHNADLIEAAYARRREEPS